MKKLLSFLPEEKVFRFMILFIFIIIILSIYTEANAKAQDQKSKYWLSNVVEIYPGMLRVENEEVVCYVVDLDQKSSISCIQKKFNECPNSISNK